MGSHSLISTARAESHWFIRCPNQVIWSSNAVLFRIEKKIKIVPRRNQSRTSDGAH
jgi:hypothetical protein